jgi:hypothetical protein
MSGPAATTAATTETANDELLHALMHFLSYRSGLVQNGKLGQCLVGTMLFFAMTNRTTDKLRLAG